MAEMKTKPNELDVNNFIEAVEDEQKRSDSQQLLEILKEITQEPPKMWGSTIIGFGSYHYKYDSGREGDYFITGFSPRKQNLTIYIMSGFEPHEELMSKLGKYKTGKSCLYVKKLEDINLDILKDLIRKSVDYMIKRYH